MEENFFNNIKGRKIKIGLDVDGVLAMSVEPVVERFNKDFKTSYKPKDFTGWNSVAGWVVKQGLTQEKAIEYEHFLWTDPEILFKSPPGIGTKEFIKAVIKNKIDFYVITSRIPSLRDSTISWFGKNLPLVSKEKIYINQNSLVSGDVFKKETIGKLEISLHIDDSPEHSKAIVEETSASVILLSYPNLDNNYKHSKLFRLSKPRRIANLRDVHKIILGYTNLFRVAQSY